MATLKKIRGFITFYRNFHIASLVFDLWACYVFYIYRSASYLVLFPMLKVFVSLLLLFFWQNLRSNQLYYYYHLQISRGILYLGFVLLCQLSLALMLGLTSLLV